MCVCVCVCVCLFVCVLGGVKKLQLNDHDQNKYICNKRDLLSGLP